jgi:hypothetical protein
MSNLLGRLEGETQYDQFRFDAADALKVNDVVRAPNPRKIAST